MAVTYPSYSSQASAKLMIMHFKFELKKMNWLAYCVAYTVSEESKRSVGVTWKYEYMLCRNSLVGLSWEGTNFMIS